MKKDWWKTNLFMAPALLIAFVGSIIFLMLTFGRGCQNEIHRFREGVAAENRIYKQLKPCPECGSTRRYSIYRKTKDGKDVSENTDEKDMLVRIVCSNDCFIATEYKSSVKEAIDAWNKKEVCCLLSEEELKNRNKSLAVIFGIMLVLLAIFDWVAYATPYEDGDLIAEALREQPCLFFVICTHIVGIWSFVHYVVEFLI